MKKILFIIACLMIMPGCRGIKVGDVKFSPTEICSKEYGEIRSIPLYFTQIPLNDIYHPTLGCLPPQRHAEVSKFHFSLQRPPITLSDAVKIDRAAPESTKTFNNLKKSEKQPNLDSIHIGKIFELQNMDIKDRNHKVIKKKPEPLVSGSFTYPPLGEIVTTIPTTVLISSEVFANEDVNKRLSVEVDVGSIINKYLQTNYPGLPPIVENELKDLVTKFDKNNEFSTSSIGKFQYVSIQQELLDQVLQELQNRCLISYFDNKDIKIEGNCLAKGEEFNSTFQIKEYVNLIENRLKHNNENNKKRDFGLIIGAAILNTSGETTNCDGSNFNVGYSAADSLSVRNCSELAMQVDSILDKHNKKVEKDKNDKSQANLQGGTGDDKNQNNVKVPEQVKQELPSRLASIYFNRKSAKFKYLKLDGHSSILAIHYVVLQLPEK